MKQDVGDLTPILVQTHRIGSHICRPWINLYVSPVWSTGSLVSRIVGLFRNTSTGNHDRNYRPPWTIVLTSLVKYLPLEQSSISRISDRQVSKEVTLGTVVSNSVDTSNGQRRTTASEVGRTTTVHFKTHKQSPSKTKEGSSNSRDVDSSYTLHTHKNRLRRIIIVLRVRVKPKSVWGLPTTGVIRDGKKEESEEEYLVSPSSFSINVLILLLFNFYCLYIYSLFYHGNFYNSVHFL